MIYAWYPVIWSMNNAGSFVKPVNLNSRLFIDRCLGPTDYLDGGEGWGRVRAKGRGGRGRCGEAVGNKWRRLRGSTSIIFHGCRHKLITTGSHEREGWGGRGPTGERGGKDEVPRARGAGRTGSHEREGREGRGPRARGMGMTVSREREGREGVWNVGKTTFQQHLELWKYCRLASYKPSDQTWYWWSYKKKHVQITSTRRTLGSGWTMFISIRLGES